MKLQANESSLDRIVRSVVGIVLIALAVAGTVAAPWLFLVSAVGAILVVTGLVGFCPLYAVLRISTLAARN